MLLYVVYVAMRISGEATAIPLVLPRSFIVSTLILIGISTAMHFAVNAAKRDETSWLIQMSGAALVMAVLFFVVQGDGMYWLIEGIGKTENATNNAYGLTFVLAVVHALHVVGGLVSIVWVFVNGMRHQYDHERWWPVQYCALYWHFLDVVWIVMLGGFIAASFMIAA